MDGAVARLAKNDPKRYGKPDNIQVDAKGLINQVEEVKYFSIDKLEALAKEAKINPKKVVERGVILLRDKYPTLIQFKKHQATINAIRNDMTKVNGQYVKGVATDVKYVLTLPKAEGNDYLRANSAFKDIKQAFKDNGINIEVKYSNQSTKDIDLMVKTLNLRRNK